MSIGVTRQSLAGGGVPDMVGLCGQFRDDFSYFSTKSSVCDLSLEPSKQDSSNVGTQHMFLYTNLEIIPKLSLSPSFIWSTVALYINLLVFYCT